MSMPISKKSNGEDTQNSRRSRSTASAPASEKRTRRKSGSAVPATPRKVQQGVVAPEPGAERLERGTARAPATGELSSGAPAAGGHIGEASGPAKLPPGAATSGASPVARDEAPTSAAPHPVNGNPAPPSVGTPANEIAASPTPAIADPFVISPEERCRLIAEAAYFRAQRRGFDGGEEQALQDWLEAEAEIDRALSGANRD